MSGLHYSSRPYRPGDEDAINHLYLRITGRTRTREQWAWQWQQGPAGPGDIWLIEATHPNGQVELIGHHGIMPVRFTWGDKDLLFGKTENTMVLPEYRRKILYSRFERRFAKEYEPRYHALFSTMGPAAAIRQRRAMGYVAEHQWVSLENSVAPWGSVVRLAQHPRFRSVRKLTTVMFRQNTHARLPEGVNVIRAEKARTEPFLQGYWNRARSYWGIAPSRAAEDLAWRYWDNPYSPRYAVVVQQPGMGDALVIVEHYAPGAVSIEDFSAESPDRDLLLHALQAATNAVCKYLGVRLVTCRLTDDALPITTLTALRGSMRQSLISRVRQRVTVIEPAFMPRKLTTKGIEQGLSGTFWNATLAIAEGRR